MVYDMLFHGLTRPHESVKIWRYLNLPKFINLLDTRSLYFSNVAKFDDTYEGRLPQSYLNAINKKMEEQLDDGVNPFPNATKMSLDNYRRRLLVNCWHINEYESAAMWDLYSHRNLGIAIQSTFGSLKESIHDTSYDVDIAQISYIDYEAILLNQKLITSPELAFFHKRLSFSHEKELRAFTIIYDNDLSRDELGPDITLPLVGKAIKRLKGRPPYEVKGKYIPTNLTSLIKSIWLSPLVQEYFIEVIKSVLKKYNISIELNISNLYSSP
jgi:hypothetical protein